MKKSKKVFSIILNVLLWIIIFVAAGVTIVSLSTKEKGVANVAGYIPFSIQTGSMEDYIKKGDLIITKKYESDIELKKGDVISFFAFEQDTKIIKTHRIEEVKNNNGILTYVTKGDNNPERDDVEVASGDIISIYTGTRIGILGYVLSFLKSKYGFLICIILPLFSIFVYQLYKFIAIIIDEKKKKALKEIEEAKKQ